MREYVLVARSAVPDATPPPVRKGNIAKQDVLQYLESLALEEWEAIDQAVEFWHRHRRWPARMKNLARYFLAQRLDLAAHACGWALTSKEDFQRHGAPQLEFVDDNVFQWLLTTYWELHGPGEWARDFYEHGCYDSE